MRSLDDTAHLRFMAKALHPAAFADVDPLAELQSYYARYLPVKLDGTFMLRLDPSQDHQGIGSAGVPISR